MSDLSEENLTALLHSGSTCLSLCSLRSLAASFGFRVQTDSSRATSVDQELFHGYCLASLGGFAVKRLQITA